MLFCSSDRGRRESREDENSGSTGVDGMIITLSGGGGDGRMIVVHFQGVHSILIIITTNRQNNGRISTGFRFSSLGECARIPIRIL